MKKIIATALLAATSLAHAHGGKQQGKVEFDPASTEQKAFGIAGDPHKANKTIRIAMNDGMRFTPERISVHRGDVVRLVVSNRGKMRHEMILGTAQELADHAELMKKFPNMEHAEPYMAHVDPGHSEEIVWHFNRPGEFDFACLMPGHFEAGMTGKITVNDTTTIAKQQKGN